MSTTTPDPATGLTSDEASRRLAAHGPNAVPDVVQHPIQRALGKLWAPVPWMLEAAVLLQLALGEYVEASAIAFLLAFNAGLARGILMAPLPATVVACVFGAAIALAFCLDTVKIMLFRRLAIA